MIWWAKSKFYVWLPQAPGEAGTWQLRDCLSGDFAPFLQGAGWPRLLHGNGKSLFQQGVWFNMIQLYNYILITYVYIYIWIVSFNVCAHTHIYSYIYTCMYTVYILCTVYIICTCLYIYGISDLSSDWCLCHALLESISVNNVSNGSGLTAWWLQIPFRIFWKPWTAALTFLLHQ